MTVRSITADEVTTYQTDGMVKLATYVSGDQVDQILSALDNQMTHPGPNAYNRDHAQDRCFALDHPALRSYVLDPVMGENAARAMACDEARFFFDHLFAFAPDTPVEAHYWHQDQPYWPIEGEHIVSVWLSLTACEPDTSALKMIRGSHLADRFFRPSGFDGSSLQSDLGALADKAVDARNQFLDHPPPPYHLDPESSGVVEFGFEAGDALMFHTKAVHSSGGNKSKTKRRVAYSIRYVGDDARMTLRRGVFQDAALLPDDDQQFEVGAPLRSRRWPVVFDRSGSGHTTR